MRCVPATLQHITVDLIHYKSTVREFGLREVCLWSVVVVMMECGQWKVRSARRLEPCNVGTELAGVD